MSKRPLTRRRIIALIGGSMTAGLAGCVSGSSNQPTNSGNGDDAHDESTSPVDSDGDDDHDHDTDPILGHPEEHIEVTMESDDDGHHFIPHLVHIEPGGTVTWILDSGVHNTVAYHPDNANILPSASDRRIPNGTDPWASDLYRTHGDTFELTLEEEGIYDYVCTVMGHHHRTHESVGMVGRVVVGEPELDPGEQPALQPPSTGLPDAARHELKKFNDQTRSALGEH